MNNFFFFLPKTIFDISQTLRGTNMWVRNLRSAEEKDIY